MSTQIIPVQKNNLVSSSGTAIANPLKSRILGEVLEDASQIIVKTHQELSGSKKDDKKFIENDNLSLMDRMKLSYREGLEVIERNKVDFTFDLLNDLEKYDKNVDIFNNLLNNINYHEVEDKLNIQLALLRTILPTDSGIKFINEVRDLYPNLSNGFKNIRVLNSKELKNTECLYRESNKTISISPFCDRLDILFGRLVLARQTTVDKAIISQIISNNPQIFLQLMYAFSVWNEGSSSSYIDRIKHYLSSQIFGVYESKIKNDNDTMIHIMLIKF